MRLLSLFALIFVLSCSSKKESNENPSTSKLSQEGSFEAEIIAIDANLEEKGQVALSMRYSKENDVSIQAKAYFDETGKIIKIDEQYSDGTDKNNGVNSFYLKEGKVFASKEHFDDRTSAKPGFIDRLSFYDKNEQVTKTYEKRVDFEEELENIEYTATKTKGISIARAKRILDQKGEFETTFQGFIEVQVLNYLVLGPPDPNGYTTTLRVDNEDAFIKTLLQNPKKYLNRKVAVDFEQVIDGTGFQYQTYVSGEFKD